MSHAASFLGHSEAKVKQQLRSQNVGYLLGAGASYLDGKGYPLAGELWKEIATKIRSPEREKIQAALNGGAGGIEDALDLLDDGPAVEKPHRHLVTEAIAERFLSIVPSPSARGTKEQDCLLFYAGEGAGDVEGGDRSITAIPTKRPVWETARGVFDSRKEREYSGLSNAYRHRPLYLDLDLHIVAHAIILSGVFEEG